MRKYVLIGLDCDRLQIWFSNQLEIIKTNDEWSSTFSIYRRYFNETKDFKPGVISEPLQIALGLSKDAVPLWIHRMRVLGYPPGWLRKADMTNTTIKVFDGTETNSVQSSSSSTENQSGVCMSSSSSSSSSKQHRAHVCFRTLHEIIYILHSIYVLIVLCYHSKFQ